jgi:hypothetical protein
LTNVIHAACAEGRASESGVADAAGLALLAGFCAFATPSCSAPAFAGLADGDGLGAAAASPPSGPGPEAQAHASNAIAQVAKMPGSELILIVPVRP